MSKNLHYYLMVNGNGELVKSQAKKFRGVDDLQPLIKKYFKNVEFINSTIFKHTQNNKVVTSLLRRVVSSGDFQNLTGKRIQITKKDIDRLVDDIICIYKFNDALVFIRSSNSESLNDLPDSITNLFWVPLKNISKVINDKCAIKIEKNSRKKPTKIFISQNVKDLYNDSLPVEKISLKNKELEFNFDTLDVEPEEDYKKISDKSEIIKDENSEDIVADAEIGRYGEEIVYELLKKEDKTIMKKIGLKKIENLEWLNKEKESFKPFDLIVNKMKVEVKSSKGQGTFIMSNNEKKVLNNENIPYILLKVNGVDLINKRYEEIKIYTRHQLQEMRIQEIKSFIFKEEEFKNE